METTRPLVSIGMPVYNGERYLRAALDSLLTQTFKDFELIIADNASTDQTAEICQEYAARDRRIQYHRNERNLGATWNYNHLVELARGKYFKWAAHDDICEPEFLLKCVQVLEQDPSVVLCHPWTKTINEQGAVTGQYNLDGKLQTSSNRPSVRFRSLHRAYMCYPIFGLIRTRALKLTPLFGSFGHADGVLLARLALMGRFYEIPEHLFLNRHHAQQSTRIFSKKNGKCDLHGFMAWWDPNKTGQIAFPTWELFSEYWQAIAQTPLNFYEQLRCYITMLSWLRSYWMDIVQEALMGFYQFFRLHFHNPNKSRRLRVEV
ncbi:MAG: glycosyltransferase family 2 protein [Leptolyngbyaceae bacterium]|nr:glycosyltransferase family 2 protein [Leptolyngbyaceae bacterium]